MEQGILRLVLLLRNNVVYLGGCCGLPWGWVVVWFVLPLLLGGVVRASGLLFLRLIARGGEVCAFLGPMSCLVTLRGGSLFRRFSNVFTSNSLLISTVELMCKGQIAEHDFSVASLTPRLLGCLVRDHGALCVMTSNRRRIRYSIEVFRRRCPRLHVTKFEGKCFSSSTRVGGRTSRVIRLGPSFLVMNVKTLVRRGFLLGMGGVNCRNVNFAYNNFIRRATVGEVRCCPG